MKELLINKNNVEEIIAKKIDAVALPEEIEALLNWRKLSSENEQYYQGIVKVNGWYSEMQSYNIDIDKAWNKVNDKMKDQQYKSYRNKSLQKYLGYAASFIFLICVGLLLRPEKKSQELTSGHNGLQHTLKDGSIVTLKANSVLSQISIENREYNFSGKAKFEVVHDESKPFIIHIDNIEIKDLGTIFNIDAEPSSDTVFVKVTEGLVQFYTKTQEGIHLEQGEEGMYIKSKNKFFKRSINPNDAFLSIAFYDSTLGDVIEHLSYSFRKQIVLENENISECQLTVDFSKASYDLVKEIIEETFDLSINDENSTLTITGTGCK